MPVSRSKVSSALSKVVINQSADKKLRVLLVTEGDGQSLFGVAKVVEDLRRRISSYGAVMKVAALVVEKNGVLKKDDAIVELPYWKWTKTLRFHLRQSRALAEVVKSFQPDVIHVHGVFVPLHCAAVLCATRRNIPVVISVHGMLEPWLWKQRGPFYYWLKRFYWNVMMKPAVKLASYVHVITQQEADTLTKEFPRVPQILISNAIDLTEYSAQQITPDAERYILFLGRIHPKKGIDLLIAAFAAMKSSGCRLLIAGSDHSVEYTNHLKKMVRERDLQDKVSFLGGVFGEEKFSLIARAWVVTVPSYSDVVALVNLEAAASFTPTITTNMTGLSDWSESGGLLIDPDVTQLTLALEQALSWTLEERLARGLQSRRFVAERYSWDVIGKRWLDTYKKISSESRL